MVAKCGPLCIRSRNWLPIFGRHPADEPEGPILNGKDDLKMGGTVDQYKRGASWQLLQTWGSFKDLLAVSNSAASLSIEHKWQEVDKNMKTRESSSLFWHYPQTRNLILKMKMTENNIIRKWKPVEESHRKGFLVEMSGKTGAAVP